MKGAGSGPEFLEGFPVCGACAILKSKKRPKQLSCVSWSEKRHSKCILVKDSK
jgi:hypothetical protein